MHTGVIYQPTTLRNQMSSHIRSLFNPHISVQGIIVSNHPDNAKLQQCYKYILSIKRTTNCPYIQKFKTSIQKHAPISIDSLWMQATTLLKLQFSVIVPNETLYYMLNFSLNETTAKKNERGTRRCEIEPVKRNWVRPWEL